MINVNQLSDIQNHFHGTSVSQMDESHRTGLDDMLLVASEGESRSISYGQLLNQLYEDVLRRKLSVGSMAFEGKGSFSLTSHLHDGRYNKLSVSDTEGAYKILSAFSESLHHGTEVNVVRCSRYVPPTPPEPAPGTVKFVYSEKRTYGDGCTYSSLAELIAAKQFDGWIYADKSYPYIEFTSSYPNRGLSSNVVSSLEVFRSLPSYGKMGKSDKIYIPDFREYFKAANGPLPDNQNIVMQDCVLGLPPHSHGQATSRASIFLESSANSRITTYEGSSVRGNKRKPNKVYGPHNGVRNKNSHQETATFTFNPKNLNLPPVNSQSSGGGENLELNRSELLVMVYIGGRNKPYRSNIGTDDVADPNRKFTVSFDLQYEGGQPTPESREITIGMAVGSLPEIQPRDNYIRRGSGSGWFTQPRGGQEVTERTTIEDDVILYAQWEESRAHVQIVLDHNDGEGASDTIFLEIGSRLGENLPTSVEYAGGEAYENFEFGGWWTQMVGGEPVTDQTQVNSDATFYAHWTVTNDPPELVVVDGVLTDVHINGNSSLSIPHFYSAQPDQGQQVEITAVGTKVLQDNDILRSLTIEKGISSIGDYSFSGCGSLEYLSLPSSLTCIFKYAFSDCGMIDLVEQGINCQLGEQAFQGTSAQTWNLTITRDGEWSTGSLATHITANTDNSYLLTSQAVYGRTKSRLRDLVLSEGVTKIGDYALSGCNISSVSLPATLTQIGRGAFENCDGLQGTIDIPVGVSAIDQRTFMNDSRLEGVDFGDNVVRIEASAFCGCSSLTSLELGDSNVQKIGQDAFRGSGLTSVSLPQSISAASAADGRAFYDCKNLRQVAFGKNVGGSTVQQKVFEGCDKIDTVTLSKGIAQSRAMKELFPDAYLHSLQHVYFNDDVDTIGEGEFMGCGNLTEIELPDSCTAIQRHALADCQNLSAVRLNNGLTSFNQYMLSGSTNISVLHFPEIFKRVYFQDMWQYSMGRDQVYLGEKLLSIVYPHGTTDLGFSEYTDSIWRSIAESRADKTTPLTLVIPSTVSSLGEHSSSDPFILVYPQWYYGTVTGNLGEYLGLKFLGRSQQDLSDDFGFDASQDKNWGIKTANISWDEDYGD